MQKKISIQLSINESTSQDQIKKHCSQQLSVSLNKITGFHILKKSIDARSKQIKVNLTLQVFIDENFIERSIEITQFQEVFQAKKTVLIVGAGPAGLFAALQLLELGIKPIIIERGKDVKSRRRDLAKLNKEGIINPESNYCFGEGGAGTYSDGKLYTRSNKRGSIDKVLNLFVQFGADEKILYESHPHIGTNKLPHIIQTIRQQITDCGGEILFETKLVDFEIVNNKIQSIITQNGDRINVQQIILATGHSARDVFELLNSKNIIIEAKPFALGVRVEHPQHIIDSIQYHCLVRNEYLPPASYSLVQQVENRGVFSFCMCPGGIIAPASTNYNELVVNGWSPSKRNNAFANSGMVVQLEIEDLFKMNDYKENKNSLSSPLSMMYFQQSIEKIAFEKGGGKFVAPAQRLVDFTQNKLSNSLPENSYIPGLHSVELNDVLPDFIHSKLQQAFKIFGKKLKGYFTNEAVVVATESRTSSPVRIPRNAETFEHPQISNLYPCAEGAGYAGGIVSAAMDGMKIAHIISQK